MLHQLIQNKVGIINKKGKKRLGDKKRKEEEKKNHTSQIIS